MPTAPPIYFMKSLRLPTILAVSLAMQTATNNNPVVLNGMMADGSKFYPKSVYWRKEKDKLPFAAYGVNGSRHQQLDRFKSLKELKLKYPSAKKG